MIRYKAYAFIKRDYKILISYKFALLTTTFGVVFPLLSYFFIAKLIPASAIKSIAGYGADYFSFTLIGVAFTTYFTMAIGEFSSLLRRDQMAGCFEAILSSRTSIQSMIFLSAIFKFIHNGTVIIVMFLFAILFLHFDISHMNIAATLVTIFLSVLLFISLGILSASGMLLFKQGDLVGFIFGAFSSFIGGAVFPTTVLPPALKELSLLLPVTHSLHALRLSILKGYSISMLLPELGVLAGMSALLFPLSLKVFEWAVEKGKRDGTLGHY